MQHVQVLQQVHQTYSQVKLWQLDIQWVLQQSKQPQRKQDKVEDSILSIVLPLVTKQERGIVAKANRIVDGKRNANIPVDMSDHFYDHGNEYCRYLITDPRSDRKVKNVKKEV
tara:strand:- start:629 stop:967 length:339 start_codon:yes stop_codon:yes gene_type:complete